MKTESYVVIAYRWGWLNNHHYMVRVVSDKQAAIDAADVERDRRAGKYGVGVWPDVGDLIHYAPSSYQEDKPFHNHRIDMFERVGNRVVSALEQGKPLTLDQIKDRWQAEQRIATIMEGK